MKTPKMVLSDLSAGMRRAESHWSAASDFPLLGKWMWRKAEKLDRNLILLEVFRRKPGQGTWGQSCDRKRGRDIKPFQLYTPETQNVV